jgi:hypothetical protein
MEALGMHAVLPERTIRVILSHLAAFHAAFWERRDPAPALADAAGQPVDYFYRCVVDVLTVWARYESPRTSGGPVREGRNLMDLAPDAER